MDWTATPENSVLCGDFKMTIKSWLKKSAMALSLAGAISGCDMLSPEGVPAKQDADGVLSAEEQQQAEQALSSKAKVNDFLPFRPLVNDFNVFMGNEMASQGLNERRFDDELHVYMVRDEDEMAEKYSFGNRPWVPPAFHGDMNSTLYLMKDNVLPANFVMSFTHEAGHHFRSSAYEFPSKAHETYFALKAYGFNRRIGSLFANYSAVVPYPLESDPIKRCLPIDDYFPGDFHKYYALGDLGFLVQANLENGNLEKAFNNILTRPILYLERTTVDAARQYSDVCQAGLGELNKLLEKPGFMQGILRYMSRNEADEFVDYLRINATNIYYSMIESENLPVNSAEKNDFIANLENFLDANPSNPYFKGQVTSILSFEYAVKANAMLIDLGQMRNMEGKIGVHNLAKRIIELNRDYPCEYGFYDCMGEASEIRASHVLGYLFATINAEDFIPAGIETNASMIALSEEYVSKFYPDYNFHFEDGPEGAVSYTPRIMMFAARMEDAMSRAGFQHNDFDEGVTHFCRATDWYLRVLEAGCRRMPDGEQKDLCIENIDASMEQNARVAVDLRADSYNAYCRIY